MDAQTFLDNFATVAEGPAGVDQLRDLVLDLAVRGQLAERDPTDGDGHAIVTNGGAAIAEAIANGWTRRREVSDPIPDEIPFPIPEGWAWARLPQVTHGLGQLTPRSSFTYLDVSSVDGEAGLLNGVPTVLAADEAPTRARKAVAQGVVLYSTIRPYLKNVVLIDRDFDPPAIASTAFAVLCPVPGLDARFLKACLRSAYFSRFVESRQKGVAYPAINDGDLARGLIPVPPPAEQDRIVAKVDELMALCDTFGALKKGRRRATIRFQGSALQALTEADTRDQLRQAWERVSKAWPALTDHPEATSAWHSTVLQLAIEGRLVSRLIDEGTGEDAIRDLTFQRDELARVGLVTKPQVRRPVDLNDVPFSVPSHWSWVRVEDVVTHIVDCLHRTPTYSDTGYPAIRTCDVEPGRVLLDQALLVDEATFAEQTTRLVPEAGDVLYSREGGRYGIAAVVPQGVKLCLSQRMMQFRCGEAVVPDFFSWFLNSPLGFGQATEDVGGSASPHVNIRSIRHFLMPLPPTKEQRRIVSAITRMIGQIDDLSAAINHRERIGLQLGAAIAAQGLRASAVA